VLWNVFATPELSLAPVQWCYPLLGCFAYRGFYAQADAQAAAALLRRKGYDVDIGGVPAYSTLGWFDDPVTNTMMRWDDGELVGTIFHELAHQRVYASSDTAFNESYANFVQAEGLREFRAAGLLPGISASDAAAAESRQRQFVALVLACRERLDALYRSDLPDEAKRSGKAAEFERLRTEYQALRDGAWQGYRGYDDWFAQPLNNASLLPFGLYEGHGAAFEVLFERCGRNWRRFHAEVRRLAKLGAAQRAAELEALQHAAGDKPGDER
jgi:predicted aminopeptidase